MASETVVKKSSRLASLDFMRGVIMILLMIESTHLYLRLREVIPKNTFGYNFIRQFFHNNWEGLNFWDLIQPSFMFMAGVAMAYSIKKQKKLGVSWNKRFYKILKRGGWLIFFGIFKRIHEPNWFSLQTLDVTDILTQLAFTSLIAFLISEWKIRNQIIVAISILIVTDLLYRVFYIPNWIEGYTDGKNFGSYIDWLLLNQQNNHYVFINWLPTSVHTIAGVIVGKLLIQNNNPLKKIIVVAFLSLILGYGLDWLNIIPIIKPIATVSFMLASLGYCLLILSVIYWWIDILNHKKYLLFFKIVGMNSIFVYLFCDIVGYQWLNDYGATILGPIELTLGMPHQWFLVMSAIAVFLSEWYVCLFLYKKNIFFKV